MSAAKPATASAARKAFRERAKKSRAAVDKAKATKAANMLCGDRSALVADAHDNAAQAAIGRDTSRWTKAIARLDDAGSAPEAVGGTPAPAGKLEPQPSARMKRTAVDRLSDPPPATGIALIERVTQAVERELSQIEIIVGGHHVKPAQRTEAERRARTLASLARTLTEVRRLRADEKKSKTEDDDTMPRDLDEFRRALSRRLEQMVRATTDVSAGGDEPE